MRHRAFEKVQGGNERRLTIEQHVFPEASIKRFAGPDGRVAFVAFRHGKSWRETPGHVNFCARRAWDQWAEAGFMQEIENRFQAVAERLIADPGGALSAEDDEAASRFFALWCCRAHYRYDPDDDVSLGHAEGQARTKDREEWLESHGIGFFRPGSLPARQLYSLRIQRDTDDLTKDLLARRWGILMLEEEGLIVPDVPNPARRCCIPLTPGLCLAWGRESGMVSGADARRLNQELREGCQDYYFCRTAPGLGLAVEF
jgi:hypothetical protein